MFCLDTEESSEDGHFKIQCVVVFILIRPLSYNTELQYEWSRQTTGALQTSFIAAS